jgi:hypothetical protein
VSGELTAETERYALSRASLEWWLTSPCAFGLTTATPLQRAICRLADGKPLAELASHPSVINALGISGPIELAGPCKELAVVSGVRGGKSLLAAAIACKATQSCDFTGLGPGEVPRFSIVSVAKDLADVVLNHVVGRLSQSPLLSSLVLGQSSADSIHLRHPSGRPVQIKVVAGARAGASLVARWSAGCVFDEFARMVGEGEGVVNWDESRDSVFARLRPGAKLVHISSPWAPFGPAYKLVQDYWGKPSTSLVVVKAPGYDMNPAWWTPERIEETKRDNPEAYRTDVLASFRTLEESLFPSALIERATRAEPMARVPIDGATYTAAMDPATRGNAWTLVIATRMGDKKVIVAAHEWIGSPSEPLDPALVLIEVAGICRAYRISHVDTDQWMGDALEALARRSGFSLTVTQWTDAERTRRYLALRTRLELDEVELPPVPRLRADLLRVKKKTTNKGVTIHLPLTSDKRHCDFAPSVVLSLSRYLDDVRPEKTNPYEIEEQRMLEALERRHGNRREDTW